MVLEDIIAYLLEQVLDIFLNALLYPLNSFFAMVGHWISVIIDPFVVLVGAMYGIFYSLYSFFTSFYRMFPEPYGAIFLLILTMVVSLRVYHFLKDISILGNKV
jgi:hypothetical protein